MVGTDQAFAIGAQDITATMIERQELMRAAVDKGQNAIPPRQQQHRKAINHDAANTLSGNFRIRT